MASYGACTPGVGESKCSLVSHLIRIIILLDQDPTLMTSFNLNYFLRGSVSKYSYTGGIGLQYEFAGIQTFSS